MTTKEKIKVDELNEFQLNYWILKSEGIDDKEIRFLDLEKIDWNFVGEIIENLNITIVQQENQVDVLLSEYGEWVSGKTTLQAIKRCIVKRKYGEEVDI